MQTKVRAIIETDSIRLYMDSNSIAVFVGTIFGEIDYLQPYGGQWFMPMKNDEGQFLSGIFADEIQKGDE